MIKRILAAAFLLALASSPVAAQSVSSRLTENYLITDTSTSAGYGRFRTYTRPLKTGSGNVIVDSLISRFDDFRGGGSIFNEWRVMQTPLNPSSGMTGAPADPQLFNAILAEWNPQNRHGDTGYASSRHSFNNWTGGLQIVPETQDFSALLGTNRIGYHTLFSLMFGGSSLTSTDGGLTAKTYNAILAEPNAIAPLGRFSRVSGHRDFAKAVASVGAAGSGYVVGDILTVSGGTLLSVFPATSIEVTSVDGGGAITGARVYTPGFYTATPASPASTTGGTGTGATINITWSGAADNPEAILEASEAWNKGIDLTGATFVSNPFSSTGFSVDNAGAVSGTRVNIAKTWNNAGSTFYGVFQNITNTASAAASRLMELQIGGVSYFSIDTSGNVRGVASFIPSFYGGAGAGSSLLLASTSGAGTTDSIVFKTGSLVERWRINTNGHLLAGTDNSYDIGAAAATRPRTIYVGTGLDVAGNSGLTATKTVRDAAGTGTCTMIFTGGILTGGTC